MKRCLIIKLMANLFTIKQIINVLLIFDSQSYSLHSENCTNRNGEHCKTDILVLDKHVESSLNLKNKSAYIPGTKVRYGMSLSN